MRKRHSTRCSARVPTIKADGDGAVRRQRVATVPVAQGDRVQPGAALLTLTRLDGLVVTIGIDPGDRNRVRPRQSVHLTPLGAGPQLDGQILRVDGVLNPKTRLIDADVSVSPGVVIAGEAFRADITVGQLQGWIVPHDAVLSDAKGSTCSRSRGNTASRVDVTVAGSAGNNDVVDGKLDPQRALVVAGNYQLSDHATLQPSNAPFFAGFVRASRPFDLARGDRRRGRRCSRRAVTARRAFPAGGVPARCRRPRCWQPSGRPNGAVSNTAG